jgi:hypothetical protein
MINFEFFLSVNDDIDDKDNFDNQNESKQSVSGDDLNLNKVDFEHFKQYLKDNGSFILYKFWIDIEHLNTLLDHKEKTKYFFIFHFFLKFGLNNRN